jgi:hypothetical protein
VTRLAAALKAAGEQLAPARARRRVVILLSDCRSTDEDDTLEMARALPELIILAPADDHEQAAYLAALAGARWGQIAHPWTPPRPWITCSRPRSPPDPPYSGRRKRIAPPVRH